MASMERLDALMAETGEILELAQVVRFEDGGWALEVDEDTLLFVDYEEDQERLILSGEVAPVLAEARASAHALLLHYNNQWKSTGGVRMALDGPDGSVIQICDLAATQLDAQKFSNAVQTFAGILISWREMLAKAPARTGDVPESLDMAALGFIRA